MSGPEDNGADPAADGRTFPVCYRFERRDPPWSRAQLVASGEAGCDHALWVPIFQTGDGGPLVLGGVFSMNGKDAGALPDFGAWEIWVGMAKTLAGVLGDTYQGRVCAGVTAGVAKAREAARRRGGSTLYGPDGKTPIT